MKKTIKKKRGTKPYTKCKVCSKKTTEIGDKMLTCINCTKVFHAICL